MSRFSRPVRIAVAGLLAVSALTIFGASPASAAATASMVDNGNGSITVTYSGAVPGSNDVVLAFMSQGATCPVNAYPNPYLFNLYANPMGGGSPVMAASPATIVVGTSVMAPNSPSAVPLTAGNYQACLYTAVNSTYTNAGSLAVTIGQVTPTTTTTTASPTTTTAAGTPVTPAFTG